MKEILKEYFREKDKELIKEKKRLEPNMVYAEGGEFIPSWLNENKKTHDILVCKYQVTQDIYEELMGYNPSFFKDARRPVEGDRKSVV